MDEMLLKAIAEFGVPTIICFFLLFRFTKSIDALTDAINNLVKSNTQVVSDVRELKDFIYYQHREGFNHERH